MLDAGSPSMTLATLEIARKVTPADYGPLTDEDLTAIAAESFALLDQEESRAGSR